MKIKKLSIAIILCSLSACANFWSSAPVSRTVVLHQYGNELEREPVPGTVHGPWAEAMYQDVEVPGAIDKKGVYYRPPHRTVVEVRKEKYQRAQYPDADGVYRERD
ncbi:MAG TPA: hypothetical protein PKA63_13195 [Oligoflexia bacterium]|nr:hypothetical protein [Oligoflexia bacterium]HMP49616.1 hypothetical protein [Oligoflexia bacterium]